MKIKITALAAKTVAEITTKRTNVSPSHISTEEPFNNEIIISSIRQITVETTEDMDTTTADLEGVQILKQFPTTVQGETDSLETVTIATKDPTRTKMVTIITDGMAMTMDNEIIKIKTIKETSSGTATSTTIIVTGKETTTQAMDIITVATVTINPKDKTPNTNTIGSRDNDYPKVNYVCFDLHL